MTEAEIDRIIGEIGEQRKANNDYFIMAWRLLFRHCPDEAKLIQRHIREGDLKISELNAKLCE